MCLKAAPEDDQKAQDSAFFKCGAQQCFHYRGYVAYIRTITRFMRMSDVAVWSIRTPFREASETSVRVEGVCKSSSHRWTPRSGAVFPHCGDGTALKFGFHKHIGLKRIQDYVCGAVQIESELVGRKLVAGHPVGLESVLEFGNHLLHASSLAIAFRVYETGPLPLEVRHDISDVCSETVDLDFDNNPLQMLP